MEAKSREGADVCLFLTRENLSGPTTTTTDDTTLTGGDSFANLHLPQGQEHMSVKVTKTRQELHIEINVFPYALWLVPNGTRTQGRVLNIA